MRQRDPEKARAASRKHYELNREKMIARAVAHKRMARAKLRAWRQDYLATHPCVDCGESDPVVLEFDHQHSKSFNLGDAPRTGHSVAKCKAEAEKCEVRCANCHRRKTHQRRQG